jgi:uncharacterized protein YegP (UPF0339 family)
VRVLPPAVAGGLTKERITLVTYYYYKDDKGEWRWRLNAADGRIIADSGQGYKHLSDCLDDIRLVKNSKDAPVVQI